MRKYFLIVSALLLVSGLSVNAQRFQDGFHRDNPAVIQDGDVLELVQWNSWAQNNYGASSFLYPAEDGQVLTAFHEKISAETFLGSLRQDNFTNGNLDLTLFSYAWRRGEASHRISVGVQADYRTSVPIEIFQILKQGTGQARYEMGGFEAGARAYANLSYGYARELSDWLSVGARVKVLVGLQSAAYHITRMDLQLSGEEYVADIEADLDLTSTGGKARVGEDGYMRLLDRDRREKWFLPPGGGLAFDLGGVATLDEGLCVSVSALNLGGILWYYGNAGHSEGTISFSGLKGVTYEQLEKMDLGGQFDEVIAQFKESARVKPAAKKTRLEAVPFTLNMGAKYDMPFYRPLSVAVTGTYMGWDSMHYGDVRLGLGWNPSRRLGLMANIGAGSYGPVWGAALTVGVYKFHLNAAVQNGFGGTVPYTSTQLQANTKCLSLGVTYDI